jgi:tetratricopeptide (TPR) repeat protein
VKTLAHLEYRRGGLKQSEQWLRQNLSYLHTIQSNELRYGISASHMMAVLAARGKLAEADHYDAVARQLLARYIGENSSGYERHLFRGAILSRMRDEPALAARQEAAIFERDPDVITKMPSEALRARAEMARFNARGGHVDESLAAIKALLERIKSSPDHDYFIDDEAEIRYVLGMTLIDAGRSTDAQPHLRRAIEIKQTIDEADSVWLAQTRVALAECLLDAGKVSEAKSLLQEAARAEQQQAPLAAGFQLQLRAAWAHWRRISGDSRVRLAGP